MAVVGECLSQAQPDIDGEGDVIDDAASPPRRQVGRPGLFDFSSGRCKVSVFPCLDVFRASVGDVWRAHARPGRAGQPVPC